MLEKIKETTQKTSHFVYFFPFVSILTVILVGVVGYTLIEGWSIFDSLYMTIISITTVGYGETHNLSQYGRMFTLVLVLMGIGVIGYSVSKSVAFIVEGELSNIMKRRKMKKEIATLSNHFIVCGAGDTGVNVIKEFTKADFEFVIIDNDPQKIEQIENYEELYYIIDDAIKDSTLQAANIEKAKGLVAVLGNDKDNLFVVLTARELNPKLKIASRVIERSSERKMLIAGADEIVSPNFIGGMRLASLMIRPAVVNFLDEMLRDDRGNLRLEEVDIQAGSSIEKKDLSQSQIPQKTGLIVVALKRGGNYSYNPKSDTILEENDKLIVMGDQDQVHKLRQMASK
ncbi:MAG: potassium channel protein [Pseudomonadota bacterium]